MTLSFTTHWRDELPDFYTSLSPTRRWITPDSSGVTPRWRNSWGCPTPCSRLKMEPVSGAEKRCFRACPPLAQVYSGHQFGAWAGQLGDGRGILLGEQQLADGRRYDWHLKAPA